MKSGTCEYNMSAKMAEAILKDKKGDAKKLNKQQTLCKWVNEHLGLKFECTRVHASL